jgi:hypothetical protein
MTYAHDSINRFLLALYADSMKLFK